MNATGAILSLSCAFVVVGVLLLALLMRSLWAWWIKALAIVLTCSFFIISFYQVREFFGWPGYGKLPERFQVLWVRVVEPSRAYQEPGAIYLWLEELDANNVPNGIPRSYKLPYTKALAERSEKAREEIVNGKAQQGEAKDLGLEPEKEQAGGDIPHGAALPPADAAAATDGNVNLDPELMAQQPQRIEFAPLAVPLLPVKRP